MDLMAMIEGSDWAHEESITPQLTRPSGDVQDGWISQEVSSKEMRREEQTLQSDDTLPSDSEVASAY